MLVNADVPKVEQTFLEPSIFALNRTAFCVTENGVTEFGSFWYAKKAMKMAGISLLQGKAFYFPSNHAEWITLNFDYVSSEHLHKIG